ncbi:FxSxx-COOH system tetratricopeptide repeat protein [Dactylosporangium sp. CA-092794]|uniref:FxSxx-COOH system tetratricopeptide repeat protein n=1 Tax=Dactylosporangium sp. CA-092794 TaxID=3239929 RepID=UPI003D92B833
MEPTAGGSSEQRNVAEQRGRVHAVQHGDQVNVEHVHLTLAAERAQRPVSVVPPLGRRDPRRPVRGRDGLVASLSSALRGPGGAGRVRVLHGLAGSGKTTIALELAHRAVGDGLDVWWVDGTAEHSIAGGMLAIARQIGVPSAALRHGDAADRLWRALRERTAPWLLVLDNVDRPELLAGGGDLADGTGWLRPVPDGPGMVLVTSRDGDPQAWGSWCALEPVGMLPAAAAARVLSDYAGDAGSPGAASALAGRLGRLPLALRMAGAYLADTAAVPWPEPDAITTFDGYLSAFDADPAGATPGTAADAHRQIIGRAWELSLDLLAERGLPQARPLLRVLSYFADAPVPYALLLDPAALARASMFEGLSASSLWGLLRSLAALSLVELSARRDGDDRPDPMLAAARVHPLVRHTSRQHDGPDSADAGPIAVALVARAVRSGVLSAPHDPAAWPRWEAVTVHTLHLASALPGGAAGPDAEAVLEGAIGAVRHLRARGRFEAAEHEYRRLDGIAARVLPDGHPQLAQIRHELAFTLYYRGSFAEAEQQFQAALAMRRDGLGPDHPDTLLTRQALGRVARSLGRYPEAESRLRSVYETQRALLGADHPDTLTSQHQLARALLSRGEIARSRAEFQRVLWRRRRVLGPSHPDTLMTRHQLAKVAYREGRYDAAERMDRTVGRLRLQILGEHHPDTLHSRHGRALALAAQGRPEAAEAELRDILELRRQVFGARHPETLTTQHHLAGVLATLGRAAPAVAEYRQVLRARQDLLGDDHPDTLRTAALLHDLEDRGA